MGTPVNTTTPSIGKGSCTPISSNCVTWQGPNIPCLSLCSGDTITDVVYKIATLLCEISENVIDISEITLDCILPEGAEEPTTPTELIQMIINKVCEIDENCCGEIPEESAVLPTITLPVCLRYEDEGGDTVTELPLDEYAELLAGKICEGAELITALNEYYTSINARLSNLEETVEECCAKESEIPTITTQCLSGATEGETKDIDEAFEYLETRLCSFLGVTGDTNEIDEVKDYQCEGLSASPQLNDLTKTMSELTGWDTNPLTLSASMKNLWLTVCDIRAKVIDCCLSEEICASVPINTLAITDITESGCMITWEAPITPYTEAPIEYDIEIWEWDGIANVGAAPIVAETVTDLFYEVTTVPDVDKYYAVYVRAVYETCDPSEYVSVFGYIIQPTYTKCITLTQSYVAIEGECEGYTYNYERYTVTATLRNYATQQIITNTGTPITIETSLHVTNNCDSSESLETLFIVIPTGMSTGSNTYDNETQEYCERIDACETIEKTLNCIVNISDIQTTICPDSLIDDECYYPEPE